MMRIRLVILLSLAFTLQNALADTGQISINGTIDSSLVKSYECHELTIRKNYRIGDRNLNDMITVPIKSDGSFRSKVSDVDGLSYLSFEMFSKKDNRFINLALTPGTSSALDPAFLCNPGDSIDMEIRRNGLIHFKGKGSKKMECQLQLYNFAESYPQTNRQGILTTSKRTLESLEMIRKLCELNKQMFSVILNTYREEIPKEAFQLIEADAEFWCNYMFLSNLFLTCYNRPEELSVTSVQASFQNYLNYHKLDFNPLVVSKSLYYTELLFEIEWDRCRLFSRTGAYRTGDSFEQIYTLIKQKYNGVLRDKLLLICFQKLDKFFPSATANYLKEALEIMVEPNAKRLLATWYDKKYSAFAFELEDEVGKIHKLEDFKGKIVILDFWYTGCTWCAQLNESMKPVYTKYADNKNVVFITINVDQKKERWLSSLKGGLYTSAHGFNLHTGSLGKSHPIMQYYNIVSYPQQIIIDQNGNIASANPPRLYVNPKTPHPDATVINGLIYNNYSPFVKLINTLLEQKRNL